MADIHSFEPFWGTWRIVRALGQGSYGKVYLVQREDLGGTYYAALKHLSIPADPNQTRELYADGLVSTDDDVWKYYTQMLNTLINEIKVNDQLKGHTNIVSYEEHMIAKKTDLPGYDVFIRMEFLTSLSDYIQQQQLTMDDVALLGEDICSALIVLKRERIVHRDIKPANIFVNKGGDFKLGDFGVARTMDKTVSSMSVKGTFAYMAPEVAKGEDGSFGVDIYSLGLVMYKLLNGNRAPFLPPLPEPVTHDGTMAAQRRRFQGDPLPPPAYASPALAEIILKACAYQPGERWTSPEKMRTALRQCRAQMDPGDAERIVLSISKDPGGRTAGGSSFAAPSSMGSWSMPSILPMSPEEYSTSSAEPDNGETVMMGPEEYPSPDILPENATVIMTPEEYPVPPAPSPAEVSGGKGGGKKGLLIAGAGAAVVLLAAGLFLFRPKTEVPPAAETMPQTSSEISATPELTPTPEPAPLVADRVIVEPTAEPTAELTAEPTVPPTVAPTPTATPAPTSTPKPTKAPAATPKPTKAPAATPKPTKAPAATPKPTKAPVSTPEPVAVPEPAPTPEPAAPAHVAVTGISLSRASAVLDAGSSLRLTATVSPSNASDTRVSWSSSNSAVASVDNSGNVSTRGPGTAVITASCGGYSASCTISVS